MSPRVNNHHFELYVHLLTRCNFREALASQQKRQNNFLRVNKHLYIGRLLGVEKTTIATVFFCLLVRIGLFIRQE